MFNKLEGKIVEVFGTKANFAVAMELSQTTMIAKLKGRIDWKRNEMRKACELLGIPLSEIVDYFF
mgnify:CR=1 FL=1|jgi:hypothetical protein